jgi:hypothetical protein
VLVTAATLVAQPVALDTFGPGNTYNTGASRPVRGFDSVAGPYTSTAHLFTAQNSGTLTQIVTAFEHISGSNTYTFQIRVGDANQVGAPIGSWNNIQGGTAANRIITFPAPGGVTLNAGQTYWLVARGDGSATGAWFLNNQGMAGEWATSSNGTQYFLVNGSQLPGIRLVLEGQAPCYANCDQSTTPPILNVEDFTCFINEFAAASQLPPQQQLTHYANCDESTTPPVLNVEDFTCFINRFAQGCP